MGQLLRTQVQNPCRKLTVRKPEDIRRVGRPTVRWLESVAVETGDESHVIGTNGEQS
jgi:hypothetical protein